MNGAHENGQYIGRYIPNFLKGRVKCISGYPQCLPREDFEQRHRLKVAIGVFEYGGRVAVEGITYVATTT